MPDSAALATNAWRDAIGTASSENTVAAPNIPNRIALDQNLSHDRMDGYRTCNPLNARG